MNSIDKSVIRVWKTKDLSLASYLKTKNILLVDYEIDRNLVTFIFDNNSKICNRIQFEYQNSPEKKFDFELRGLKKLMQTKSINETDNSKLSENGYIWATSDISLAAFFNTKQVSLIDHQKRKGTDFFIYDDRDNLCKGLSVQYQNSPEKLYDSEQRILKKIVYNNRLY